MNEQPTWMVRVTATQVDDSTAYVRRHQVQVGAPISFDSEHDATTALEYFLVALGSDVVGGLFRHAKRMRITIDNIEATLECSLNNPLMFLDVVGEQGDSGLKDVRIMVYISTLADDAKIRQLWEDTLRKSPLVQTLHRALTLELAYKIVL